MNMKWMQISLLFASAAFAEESIFSGSFNEDVANTGCEYVKEKGVFECSRRIATRTFMCNAVYPGSCPGPEIRLEKDVYGCVAGKIAIKQTLEGREEPQRTIPAKQVWTGPKKPELPFCPENEIIVLPNDGTPNRTQDGKPCRTRPSSILNEATFLSSPNNPGNGRIQVGN